MKPLIKSIVYLTCIWGLPAWSFAQGGGYGPPAAARSGLATGGYQPQTDQNTGFAVKFFHARSVVGQDVKDTQGKELGTIYDIAFDPQSGEIFASIGVGAGRYALVPWQALLIRSDARGDVELSLNATLRDLQSAPTVTSSDWEKLRDPAFTQGIYAYFGLKSPMALGGTMADSLGGSSTGAGASTVAQTNKTAVIPP